MSTFSYSSNITDSWYICYFRQMFFEIRYRTFLMTEITRTNLVLHRSTYWHILKIINFQMVGVVKSSVWPSLGDFLRVELVMGGIFDRREFLDPNMFNIIIGYTYRYCLNFYNLCFSKFLLGFWVKNAVAWSSISRLT